jgi:hypothetical protein
MENVQKEAEESPRFDNSFDSVADEEERERGEEEEEDQDQYEENSGFKRSIKKWTDEEVRFCKFYRCLATDILHFEPTDTSSYFKPNSTFFLIFLCT